MRSTGLRARELRCVSGHAHVVADRRQGCEPDLQGKREVLSVTGGEIEALCLAVAAAIEEPAVAVAAGELRDLVAVHSRLYRLLGWSPEYVYRAGAAVSAVDFSMVFKRPAQASRPCRVPRSRPGLTADGLED